MACDDAIGFEFTELEGDHPFGCIGDEPAQFTVSLSTGEEMADEDGFPSSSNDAEGCFDIAPGLPVVVSCHGGGFSQKI